MLTRDEILESCANNPEAIVTLIEQMQATIVALTARVQQLEERLAKDSHNSSKPPSSDGLAKKPKSLRPPTGQSGRNSGGQPNHPGRTLRWVAQPDSIVTHTPTTCDGCGADLQAVPDDSSDAAECGLEEQSLTRRQVHDLPPLRLLVTEHRALCRTCPQCQQPNRGHFPDNVKKPVQYGPQIQGLCVYLQTYQLLPSARTCQLLRDVFACSLSEGTLANIQADCHERLAPVEEAIRAGIGGAEVVHFDETGMRAQGRLHWMHSASTPKLTYYANHAKRGRLALDAHGLLSQFKGTAVHDSFASYFGYDTCKHALCNAHLLRELIAVYEQGQEQDKAEAGKAEADKAEAINAETGKQAWAGAMVTLLCEIKKTIEAAQAIGRSSLLPEEQDAFKARYQALLEQGRKSNPPPGVSPVVCGPKKRGRIKQTSAQNLLHRLSRYQSEVLRFMSDWSVPFDNNLAERDLRMVKVRQKVSGCFRSAQGAAQFCRVRGVISTLRKQGYSLLAALQSIFVGDTCWPALLT